MKKLLFLTLFALLFTINAGYTKSSKNNLPVIKFNNAKYTLQYSAKSSETGGFLNEYYKPHQTYASWTDLIGVHHYPTSYYPIEHAREFADYLNNSGIATNIEIDDENNKALLYFVAVNKEKLPIIMEFNVFKYSKNSICGTTGLQYAKRYRLNSPLEIEKAGKSLIKTGLKSIKKIDKLKVPEIINLDINEGRYLLKEGYREDIKNLD